MDATQRRKQDPPSPLCEVVHGPVCTIVHSHVPSFIQQDSWLLTGRTAVDLVDVHVRSHLFVLEHHP
eukprot:1308812-Pyramimonas_sp.AAC.1